MTYVTYLVRYVYEVFYHLYSDVEMFTVQYDGPHPLGSNMLVYVIKQMSPTQTYVNLGQWRNGHPRIIRGAVGPVITRARNCRKT